MVLVLALVGPGCALTSKAEPFEIRYFSPVPAAAAPPAGGAPAPGATEATRAGGNRLRLGRLSASAHLRHRIVVRTSPVELAAYEDRRWTENPEEYVRRALGRVLFEELGVVHALAGASPTLDVELLAFEEVRRGDERLAAVEMHFAVHDDRDVLEAGTIRVEVPLGDDEDTTAQLAQAMGAALSKATRQIATRVVATLQNAAPTPVPPDAPPAAGAPRADGASPVR